MQIPGELFLRLTEDSAAMRAAAWESALGQALRLFGGPRGTALAAGDVAALVDGLAVQDLPRGGEIVSSGEADVTSNGPAVCQSTRVPFVACGHSLFEGVH